MPLKFAANISMLFTESPTLVNRYKAAKEFGFKYVECTFPYMEAKEKLAAARAESSLEHVLINSWPGQMEKGDMGLAALPDRAADFRDGLNKSIQYAKALGCKCMHVMAGKTTGYDLKEMEKTYLDNLQYAAETLQKEEIMCLIEPLNTRITAPNYFLHSLQKGVEYIERVNHPNLKLQFDVYHTQMIAGDLTGNLNKYLPLIGHVQIAQAPDRSEPGPSGEINYSYVLKMLEDVGYDGFVGLEYKPRDGTVKGLKWLQDMGYSP